VALAKAANVVPTIRLSRYTTETGGLSRANRSLGYTCAALRASAVQVCRTRYCEWVARSPGASPAQCAGYDVASLLVGSLENKNLANPNRLDWRFIGWARQGLACASDHNAISLMKYHDYSMTSVIAALA